MQYLAYFDYSSILYASIIYERPLILNNYFIYYATEIFYLIIMLMSFNHYTMQTYMQQQNWLPL